MLRQEFLPVAGSGKCRVPSGADPGRIPGFPCRGRTAASRVRSSWGQFCTPDESSDTRPCRRASFTVSLSTGVCRWRRFGRSQGVWASRAGGCGTISPVRAKHAALVDRLGGARWRPLLGLLDDADVDGGPPPEPDPAAVEPYRWLLTRVGEGLRLTQAGRLPPAVVEETMRALGWDANWIGKTNREDQTYPVQELRELAQRMRLLRKQRVTLLPTALGRRLAEDPAGLWWHMADRLPPGRAEVERMAGVLLLLAVAAGRPRAHAVVAEGLSTLGVVDAATGRPPDELDALGLARDSWAVFLQLGLLPRRSRDDAPPGASAREFARARCVVAKRRAAGRLVTPSGRAGPRGGEAARRWS